MPRRSILSATERESLLALPDSKDDLIRQYTFSDTDLSIIRQRRGPANRLGFAVQLCYLRFPGVILGVDEPPFPPLLKLVADQIKVGVESWVNTGSGSDPARAPGRAANGVRLPAVHHEPLPAGRPHADRAGHANRQGHCAGKRDRAPAAAVDHSSPQRRRVGEREAITRANRRIYDALAEPLTDAHRRRLDDLLKRRDNGKTTWLAWLRQSPVKPNSRHMLEHIERLKAWRALDLPSGIERSVHQNRLLKIARKEAR